MTNTELANFDLAKELPGLLGRTARVRFWLMEPGGIIADHCHDDRPAFVYLLQGEVLETIDSAGKAVTRVLRAGQSVPEGNGTRHWWINQGHENVLMVVMDIPNANLPARRVLERVNTENVAMRLLDQLLLREQYPHIPDVSRYKVQGRLLTFGPAGRLGLEEHAKRPAISYVVSGIFLEHRSDADGPIVRRQGDLSMATDGISNYWENRSNAEATLLIVEFVDCGDCPTEPVAPRRPEPGEAGEPQGDQHSKWAAAVGGAGGAGGFVWQRRRRRNRRKAQDADPRQED